MVLQILGRDLVTPSLLVLADDANHRETGDLLTDDDVKKTVLDIGLRGGVVGSAVPTVVTYSPESDISVIDETVIQLHLASL